MRELSPGFTLSVRLTFLTLVAVVAFLFTAHIICVSAQPFSSPLLPLSETQRSAFDMYQEVSIPTWWAQSQLLLASALAFIIAVSSRSANLRGFPSWLLLGTVLAFMSVDEGSLLHESIGGAVVNAADFEGSGYLNFTWVVVGIPVAILLGAAFSVLLFRLPARPRALMGLGAALFVIGALGMEMVGAAHHESYGHDFWYSILVAIEEALELIGVSVVILGMLVLVRDTPLLNPTTIHLGR